MLTTEKTVRELAIENPAATRVFERLQIDYCCGGNRTLEDACRAAGVPLDRVLASLDAAAAGPAPAVARRRPAPRRRPRLADRAPRRTRRAYPRHSPRLYARCPGPYHPAPRQ